VNRIAVVHPTTLVGKELRERLEARPDLVREIVLLSVDDVEIGAVTDNLGAAAFVTRAEEGSFDDVDLSFFCGTAELDRNALALLPDGARAVLLSRDLVPADAPPAIAGVGTVPEASIVASPHPAAVALALLLAPLQTAGLRRALATVVLPVSTADDNAIEELFEQTRGLLTFSGGSSDRFGGQVAFNLLPSTVDPGPIVAAVSASVGLSGSLSLQILQAGVFHGVAISLWVEVESDPGAEALRDRLAGAFGIRVADDPECLGPVAAASEEDLLLGSVTPAAEPGAYWIWAVMDNLGRGAALNALGIAETLLGAAPAS